MDFRYNFGLPGTLQKTLKKIEEQLCVMSHYLPEIQVIPLTYSYPSISFPSTQYSLTCQKMLGFALFSITATGNQKAQEAAVKKHSKIFSIMLESFWFMLISYFVYCVTYCVLLRRPVVTVISVKSQWIPQFFRNKNCNMNNRSIMVISIIFKKYSWYTSLNWNQWNHILAIASQIFIFKV